MPPGKKKDQPSLPAGTTELPLSALRLVCDPDGLGFETTDDLPDLEDIIGQPRAFSALLLGSEVTGPGYNTFVLGQPGSGRTTLSKEFLERKAVSMPVSDDFVLYDSLLSQLRCLLRILTDQVWASR